LAYVHGLIPPDTPVLLVGDSEFGAVKVLRQLEKWHWHYVLHQKSNHLVELTPEGAWQPFGSLVQQAGDKARHMKARLTQKHAHQANLYALWWAGYKEPWLLVTNLATPQEARRAYKRRMWIEEMFSDLKGHGFDLESTHLRHFLRLSRCWWRSSTSGS
jgi:hypothetical protein